MLDELKKGLQEAQAELAMADIALLEATARAASAKEAAARLEGAVAALTVEKPPAEPAAHLPVPEEGEIIQPSDREAAKQMSQEEFDAERRRKQNQRRRIAEKEAMENNPYAHIKCSGCGRLGTLQDQVVQAPSGATVKMMVCHRCNNQIMT